MITKLISRLKFTKVLLASTFFLFSTNSFADEKSYFYILGSKAIGSDVAYTWTDTSSVEQPVNSKALVFGYGKKLNSFSENYLLGFEIDYANKYKGSSGEGILEPCLTSWVPGECSLEYKNMISGKFLISKQYEKFKPSMIIGVSSAKIISNVDSGSINDLAGGSTHLFNKRKTAHLYGVGIEFELSEGFILKSEYLIRDFGDSGKVDLVGNNINYTHSDNYKLETLSIGLKKLF
jgi:opacity protein-like surface antigen